MVTFQGKSWLTPSEAAERYNVGLQTVYHWVYTKQLELLNLEDASLPFTRESLSTKFHISEDSLKERVARPWGAGIKFKKKG